MILDCRYLFLLFHREPKCGEKIHTSIIPLEYSSLTFDESEALSFRVSKLEDTIKGMANKHDLKGMASKDEIQELKEMINHIFIYHSSTQEEDKDGKGDLFHSHIFEKIEK